jgi:hypothetical protein
MFKSTLAGADLNFPGGIEEIRTGKDNVGMVQDENGSQPHQAKEGISNERWELAEGGGKAQIGLTPGDGMIPDLKRAFTLNLANNSVRCTDTVMRCLENRRDLLWNRNGEDKEI